MTTEILAAALVISQKRFSLVIISNKMLIEVLPRCSSNLEHGQACRDGAEEMPLVQPETQWVGERQRMSHLAAPGSPGQSRRRRTLAGPANCFVTPMGLNI